MTMADEQVRPRLGRGLATLIADSTAQMPVAADVKDRRRLAIERLKPNPRNPRRYFDPEGLADLAHSIREKAVIQPLLARPVAEVERLDHPHPGRPRNRGVHLLQELLTTRSPPPVPVLDISKTPLLPVHTPSFRGPTHGTRRHPGPPRKSALP